MMDGYALLRYDTEFKDRFGEHMNIHHICSRIFQHRTDRPLRIHPVKWRAMLESAQDFISTSLLHPDDEYVMVVLNDDEGTEQPILKTEIRGLSATCAENELESIS